MKHGFLAVLIFPAIVFSARAERWEYHIPGNYLRNVVFQGDFVWGDASQSIVCWDRRDGSYRQFAPSEYAASGYPGRDARDEANRLWNTAYPSKHFEMFLRDRAGNTWFESGSRILCRFDGSSWSVYGRSDALATVNEIVCDREGNLWFATANGVSRWNGTAWKHFTRSDGLPDSVINCAALDSTGAVWFGTNGGAARYDGQEWRIFTVADGLPNNGVRGIEIDNDGRTWFYTIMGVCYLDGNIKLALHRTNLLKTWISDFAVDHIGRVWICHGAREGVTVFDHGERKIITPTDGFPEGISTLVTCDREGVLWFVLNTGIASYDGEQWRLYTEQDGLKPGATKMIVDRKNRKWLVYQKEIGCFDGSAWKYYQPLGGSTNQRVDAIGEGKNGVMYAHGNEGLARFDGVEWEFIPDPFRAVSSGITHMAEDSDGAVWFATHAGLTRVTGETWRT
jgi:ligand-binding sensor domain-containing protein